MRTFFNFCGLVFLGGWRFLYSLCFYLASSVGWCGILSTLPVCAENIPQTTKNHRFLTATRAGTFSLRGFGKFWRWAQ